MGGATLDRPAVSRASPWPGRLGGASRTSRILRREPRLFEFSRISAEPRDAPPPSPHRHSHPCLLTCGFVNSALRTSFRVLLRNDFSRPLESARRHCYGRWSPAVHRGGGKAAQVPVAVRSHTWGRRLRTPANSDFPQRADALHHGSPTRARQWVRTIVRTHWAHTAAADRAPFYGVPTRPTSPASSAPTRRRPSAARYRHVRFRMRLPSSRRRETRSTRSPP